MKFNSDAPLSAGGTDLLGRVRFCARIAEQIIIPPSGAGITLSIEGPWGFGKTSAINLIAQHLSEGVQPIIVHFNPWMVGSVEALVQEFFLQMSSAIGLSPHAKTAEGLAESLATYSSLVSVAKWIPGAEPWASLLSTALEVSGKGARAFSNLSKLNIADQKERVAKGIIALGQPFIVFIDDLDRLPPQEVFAVIRLVKAISDFPQVAYVLAFDPSYVEDALALAGIRNGRAYLDKIIQVRIPLPPIGRTQIGKIVDSEIEAFEKSEILKYFPADKDRLQNLYHRYIKYLLRTPRDVYRTFNRFRLLYPSVETEIGIADFFALESIAITAPSLYDHIREQPHAYVGSHEGEIFEKPQEVVEGLKEERQAALEKCPSAIHQPLSGLIGALFPLTSKAFLSVEGLPRTAGRIANRKNLIIALSGGLPPTEISLSTIRSFIERDQERRRIIEDVDGDIDQLEDFLDLLHDHLDLVHLRAPEQFVYLLSEIRELRIVRDADRFRGFFKADVATQTFWIFRKILEASSPEQLQGLLRITFQNADALSLAADLLLYLRLQHGIPDESRAQPESSRLVSGDELEVWTRRWVQVATEGLSIDGGWVSNGVASILFLLKSIDNSVAREVVSKRLEDGPEAIDQVFRALCGPGFDTQKGEFAKAEDETLQEFLDLDSVKEMAAARLADDNLREPSLRAIYASISTGEREYFCDH